MVLHSFEILDQKEVKMKEQALTWYIQCHTFWIGSTTQLSGTSHFFTWTAVFQGRDTTRKRLENIQKIFCIS